MTHKEVMQQALEALHSEKFNKAVTVLRTALEQPEQEPVAWMDREGDIYRMPEIKNWAPPHTLLYAAPPRREWQGLTDYEINNFDLPESGTVTIREFVRIIEAKLKEKNT